MLERITTFLIDDDLDDQEIFSYILDDASIKAECVFANDGIYALEKIKDASFSPHIIFIDINMPRMNGIDFLKELKKADHLFHVPVYMYSTSAEESVVEESKKLGAAGFIKKNTNVNLAQQEFQKIFTNHKLLD